MINSWKEKSSEPIEDDRMVIIIGTIIGHISNRVVVEMVFFGN